MMEEFGVTPQALADSVQRDLDHTPHYRDARGNEWNGVADTPHWLRIVAERWHRPGLFPDWTATFTRLAGRADARELGRRLDLSS
ncbi:hypothetical protein [Paraburkholderia strydomiana]|uniref:hypothetical protein n=1 Tax=Paraburkholderia strydomiana TaxID=1245417 RepID=UPI0038BE106E